MKTQSLLILDGDWKEVGECNYKFIAVKLSNIEFVLFSEWDETIVVLKSGTKYMKHGEDKSEYFRIIQLWEDYLSNS